MSLETVPTEIQISIIGYLSFCELIENIPLLSKAYQQFTNNDSYLWKIINLDKIKISMERIDSGKSVIECFDEPPLIYISIDGTKRFTISGKINNQKIQLEEEINSLTTRIKHQVKTVKNELSPALPALENAQKTISNITKQQFLDEIKILENPPEIVEITLSAVATLMNKEKLDINIKTFIPSILKFDNTPKAKAWQKIKKVFLSNDDLTHEKVSQVSIVAGALILWIQAQIEFAHYLSNVDPIIREIKELKQELVRKQKTFSSLDSVVLKCLSGNAFSKLKLLSNINLKHLVTITYIVYIIKKYSFKIHQTPLSPKNCFDASESSGTISQYPPWFGI
eukprot:405748_1